MAFSRRIALIVALFALLTASACQGGTTEGQKPSRQVRLYVLAAASLTDAVREIQARYEDYSGVRLVPTFSASGRLKQQIEQGAPADLFLSAGTKEMEELVRKNLIDPRFHTDLLQNELVLIAPKGSPLKGFADLALSRADRIVLGQPETTPAGRYAKETLEHLGLWEKVKPKLVFAGDVRQVLAHVKTGNADAGFVFRTDARSSGDVSVVAVADPRSHQPIVYPVGIVKQTNRPAEAQAFYRWLQGPEARTIFEKYGFKGVAAPTSK